MMQEQEFWTSRLRKRLSKNISVILNDYAQLNKSNPSQLVARSSYSPSVLQSSIDTLFSVYPPLLEDLGSRRSDQINAASEMGKFKPSLQSITTL